MRVQLELHNEVAAELAGPGDLVMKTLEEHLDCEVFLRGNVLTLSTRRTTTSRWAARSCAS